MLLREIFVNLIEIDVDAGAIAIAIAVVFVDVYVSQRFVWKKINKDPSTCR